MGMGFGMAQSFGQALGQGDATDPLSPPPMPEKAEVVKHYFAVVGGERVGPINLAAVKAMLEKQEIVAETLMWTAGLPEWVAADTLNEVEALLHNQPPAMP